MLPFAAIAKNVFAKQDIHIFMQNFVLIQPRTSLPNIFKKMQNLPILLTLTYALAPGRPMWEDEPSLIGARMQPRSANYGKCGTGC